MPGAQGEGSVEPTPQLLPSGHAAQPAALSRLATFEYVPAGHGSSAEAPSGQKLPPRHGLHPMAPSWSWYEPAGHFVHAPTLDMSLYVPAAHSAASVEPVGLKEPGLVSVHSAADLRSVRAL